MYSAVAIGTQLKAIRRRVGMTQIALARQLGWHNSRLTNYEKGHRQPSVKVLQLIADALNCTVADIVEPAKKLIVKKVAPSKVVEQPACACCEAYKSLLILLINKN